MFTYPRLLVSRLSSGWRRRGSRCRTANDCCHESACEACDQLLPGDPHGERLPAPSCRDGLLSGRCPQPIVFNNGFRDMLA